MVVGLFLRTYWEPLRLLHKEEPSCSMTKWKDLKVFRRTSPCQNTWSPSSTRWTCSGGRGFQCWLAGMSCQSSQSSATGANSNISLGSWSAMFAGWRAIKRRTQTTRGNLRHAAHMRRPARELIALQERSFSSFCLSLCF